MNIWAAEWHEKNKLDGESRHILYEDCLPKLFRRRAACRAWIQEHYGYIKERPDWRAEPYGWRMPIAVKVILRKALPETHKDPHELA